MNIRGAIQKLERHGYTVTNDAGRYDARNGTSHRIQFLANGQDGPDAAFTCVRVIREGDVDDGQSDYTAGYWCDNIGQAIKRAARSVETTRIDRALVAARAIRPPRELTATDVWGRMTANERTAVRFGMVPVWAAAELEKAHGLTAREISMLFFACARQDGGMRA